MDNDYIPWPMYLAYAAAEGRTVRLDGAEIQVCRPRANRLGRRGLVSGKKKQNTIKATFASDGNGRPMWAGAVRSGRQYDQTAVRTEGIATSSTPARGRSSWLVPATATWPEPPEQVIAPPLKPKKDPPPEEVASYQTARKAQSSQRIPAEHAIVGAD